MIGSTVRVWFGSKIRVWQLGGLARGDLFTTLLKLCVKYLWYRKDILLVLSPQNDFKVSWGHAGGRGVHYYWVFSVCPYEILPKCIFFTIKPIETSINLVIPASSIDIFLPLYKSFINYNICLLKN